MISQKDFPESATMIAGTFLEIEKNYKYHFPTGTNEYLTDVLLKHVDSENMFSSVSLDFLLCQHQQLYEDKDTESNTVSFSDVAERCLVLLGVFPEYTIKRSRTPEIFLDIGRSAYHQLKEDEKVMNFVKYVYVIQEFAPIGRCPFTVLTALSKIEPHPRLGDIDATLQ